MGDGWDANVGAAAARRELGAEGAVGDDLDNGVAHLAEEDAAREEEEGDEGLRLSAARLGALDDLRVALEVAVVLARVRADAHGKHGARGERERKVQEVQHKQQDWVRERREEVRKDRVERVRRQPVRSREQTVVHARRVPLACRNQRRRERKTDDQENRIHNPH